VFGKNNGQQKYALNSCRVSGRARNPVALWRPFPYRAVTGKFLPGYSPTRKHQFAFAAKLYNNMNLLARIWYKNKLKTADMFTCFFPLGLQLHLSTRTRQEPGKHPAKHSNPAGNVRVFRVRVRVGALRRMFFFSDRAYFSSRHAYIFENARP